jgi:ArsR family transcriptional regulator, arsenate/arsenite/antimonite-responsive transcriptional repressor
VNRELVRALTAEAIGTFALVQATVSQHLKVLKETGLIVGEIEGLRTCYCASRERLVELHDLLEGMLDEAIEVDTSGCD